MFRESLGQNEGMLFVFRRPRFLNFYMKNTPLPLSIAFMKDDGTIINIEKMKPLDATSRHWSKLESRLALEMEQGWFERSGIGVGDRIVIPPDVTGKTFVGDG